METEPAGARMVVAIGGNALLDTGAGAAAERQFANALENVVHGGHGEEVVRGEALLSECVEALAEGIEASDQRGR